jgi:peptidoglycan/xylan/chitin deacetylase (PgdA/CDA1 family)
MSLSDLSAKALYPRWVKRLTVLCYHRLLAADRTEPNRYAPVVSATRSQFEWQMAFVSRHFHPIDLSRLLDGLHGRRALPERALLVTFDDGYREFYDIAWPVMQRFGLPGVLFLATDFVGGDHVFDWEQAAACFGRTAKRRAVLPLVGEQAWHSVRARETVMRDWYRHVQSQSVAVRDEAMRRLPEALDITDDRRAEPGICLDWAQVRRLADAGLALGSHSQSHALFDRLDPDAIRAELDGSRRVIQQATGVQVRTFSYPGGVWTATAQQLVGTAGYEAAFATNTGESRVAVLKDQRLCIRRIVITRADTPVRFIAKLAGLRRIRPPVRVWS